MALFTSGVSSSLWDRKLKVIAASSVDSIDELELSVLKAAIYIICVSKGTNVVMFDLNLINKNNSIYESVYGKIGTGVSFNIDTSVSLGKMNLNITNNETEEISVELIRYKFN